MTIFDIPVRMRRNRKNSAIRALCQEHRLHPSNFINPFFLIEGENREDAIKSLPGISRLSLDKIILQAESLHKKGVKAIALFPFIEPEDKDANASMALDEDGLIPKALQTLKNELPTLSVITDIALDPFTLSGHDGILNVQGEVDNDKTLSILAQMAQLHAASGASMIAPSATMDGRIKVLRSALDAIGSTDVGIISYTAKYASSIYGPFRDAVGSGLKTGDKKSYQHNPANVREAMRDMEEDAREGADVLMVKPATYYLDVIAKMKERTNLPIAAYHVSGEYAMVMAAHQMGYLDADDVFLEALLSIKRAGADMIFTYATQRIISSLPE